MNDCTKKTLDIIKMVDLAIFWRFGDFLYTMIYIITVNKGNKAACNIANQQGIKYCLDEQKEKKGFE